VKLKLWEIVPNEFKIVSTLAKIRHT